MADLFPISELNERVDTHVIFIHGLGGHPYKTWRLSKDPKTLWLNWLGEDIERLAVWSVGYPASVSRWRGTAMHLPDRATNVLKRIIIEPGLGSGELIFIGHSMGGLVIKQMLRTAESISHGNNDEAKFLKRVRRVAFIATPHLGSEKATLVDKFQFLLKPSAATACLVRNDPNLRDLNYWYRDWSRRNVLENLILIESQPIRIAGMIVKPDSSDPGLISRPISIDADHSKICKPEGRSSETYLHILNFVKRNSNNNQIENVQDNCDLTFLQPIRDVLNGFHEINITPSSGLTRKYFNSEWYVRRPEINTIKDQLHNSQFCFLVGSSASGKTVLAKNIAFDFEQEIPVFFLDSRRISKVTFPLILQELNKIPSLSLLIIDDIHYDLRSIELIFSRLLSMGHKVLLVSRPCYQVELSRHEQNTIAEIPITFPDCYFEINASDIVHEIIRNYKAKLRIDLKDTFVKEIIKYSGNDLWILSYFLKNLKSEIDFKLVYSEVWKDVIELRKLSEDAIDIFISIARLYQFEIPVPRNFLVNKMKFQHSDINILVKMGHVGEHLPDELLYLKHSSYAKIISISGLYVKQRNISHDSLKSIHLSDFLCQLEKYIEWDWYTVFTVVRQLRYEVEVLEVLVGSDIFKAALKVGLNNDEFSLNDSAHLLSDITRITDEGLRNCILDLLDEETIVKRLNSEENVQNICGFLDGFPWIVEDYAINMVAEMNNRMATIARKNMSSVDEIDPVGFCDWMMKWNNKKSLLFDLKNVYSKCSGEDAVYSKELPLYNMGFCSKSSENGEIIICAKSIVSSAPEKAKYICKKLNFKKIADICNTEADPYIACNVINLINWIDHNSGKRILSFIDLKKFLNKTISSKKNSLFQFFAWVVFTVDRNLFNKDIVHQLSSNEKEVLMSSGWFDDLIN